MAIGYLCVRTGKPGKAGPHAAYISRTGIYARRLEKGEKLEARGVGNMPAWAAEDPLAFWRAADANERKNGAVYREMEIALPRELTPGQRKALVQEWVRQELGDKHAFQWAIHCPAAADGKEQPHVHLMFSARELDGIKRDTETFFKRYNPNNPEKGGCRKAGSGRDMAVVREELKALRARWEETCNKALEQAAKRARIAMQSYAERGLDTIPERKYGPDAWRAGGKAEVLEFRRAKAKVHKLREDAQLMVPLGPAQTLRVGASAKVVNIEEASARTLGALSEALEDFQVMGGEFMANPTKHTAFSIGELEIVEKLKAAGLPPAVVAAGKNNIIIIFKHQPISGAERNRLAEVVDRAAGHRADRRVPPTVPAGALVLEASGRTVDLERVLGKNWNLGLG